MSQNDYVIANQTAPNFRADLNLALQALASTSSGATAPSTTYANMLWYDTATNTLKMRSEADDAWINLGTLDQSLNTFAPAGVAELTQVQAEDDTSTVFGQVSGQRLGQAVAANVDVADDLNATGLAPLYACRAWVNGDGSPVVIRGSGNVSSITDLGEGYYQINFTTAMEDANYCVSATTGTGNDFAIIISVQPTYVRIQNPSRGTAINDAQYIMVAIHR